MKSRFSAILALIVCFTVNRPACAEVTKEQLAAAARAAIENGVAGSQFITLLNGAEIAALGYLNTRVGAWRRNVAIASSSGDIDSATAEERMLRITDILQRLEEKKNDLSRVDPDKDADKGKDPFYARFQADQPLGGPFVGTINLAAVPNSTSVFVLRPKIWGGGTVNPDVLSASMSVEVTGGSPGGFSIGTLDYTMDSFDIAGTPSGTNSVVIRPDGSPGTFQFLAPVGPTMLEFEARFEGEIHNDLYPQSNPIVYIADVQGFVDLVTNEAWVGIIDPMIVPGLPGVDPVVGRPRLDAGTRPRFDAALNQLIMAENTDLQLAPDVTMIRLADGSYLSRTGQGEPIIGMHLLIDPMSFVGPDGTGGFGFTDSALRIADDSDVILEADLTNIRITSDYQFLADIVNIETFPGAEASSFLQSLFASGMHELRLMDNVATVELVQASEEFTISYEGASTWITIPEPQSAVFVLIGAIGLLAVKKR